jgi:hypothetical protein
MSLNMSDYQQIWMTIRNQTTHWQNNFDWKMCDNIYNFLCCFTHFCGGFQSNFSTVLQSSFCFELLDFCLRKYSFSLDITWNELFNSNISRNSPLLLLNHNLQTKLKWKWKWSFYCSRVRLKFRPSDSDSHQWVRKTKFVMFSDQKSFK